MLHHAVGAETLDLAEPAAQREQKPESGIGIICWVGQTRADYQNPPFHGRRDKHFGATEQSFGPFTGLNIVQSQRILDGLEV